MPGTMFGAAIADWLKAFHPSSQTQRRTFAAMQEVLTRFDALNEPATLTDLGIGDSVPADFLSSKAKWPTELREALAAYARARCKSELVLVIRMDQTGLANWRSLQLVALGQPGGVVDCDVVREDEVITDRVREFLAGTPVLQDAGPVAILDAAPYFDPPHFPLRSSPLRSLPGGVEYAARVAYEDVCPRPLAAGLNPRSYELVLSVLDEAPSDVAWVQDPDKPGRVEGVALANGEEGMPFVSRVKRRTGGSAPLLPGTERTNRTHELGRLLWQAAQGDGASDLRTFQRVRMRKGGPGMTNLCLLVAARDAALSVRSV